MVEQQQQQQQPNFGGAIANGPNGHSNGLGLPPHEQSSSSLAVPAIVAPTNGQTASSQQQAQYSPQAAAGLYQQQLLKSAQQFAQQHQQHSRQPNGFNNILQQQYSTTGSQQNSPQQQVVNQFPESFYASSNGLQQHSRPGPLYAPKPTFYGQINQQQQQQQQQQHQHTQNQMYQTARQIPLAPQQLAASYLQQTQHSPAHGQAQASISLASAQSRPIQAGPATLQMLPTGAIVSQTTTTESPPSSVIEQQQRQMQQFVMSYQDQLQLQLQQQNSYAIQSQQQRQPSLHENRLAGPILGRHHEQATAAQATGVGASGGSLWPSSEPQALFRGQQMFTQQQVVQQQPGTSKLMVASQPSHRSRVALSDRDSVSTVSRFNQFDERRSMTMRSQYTTNAAGKSAGQFGFVELASAAVRQMLGLGGEQRRRAATSSPLLSESHSNEQLKRNLSSVPNAAGQLEQGHKFSQQQQQLQATKVTVIDSGDERHFRRKVLAYRLLMTRLLSFVASLFVLLSPVFMLLIPKMEPLIRAAQDQGSNSALEYNAQEPNLSPSNVVTHAVGLAGQRQLVKVAGIMSHNNHHHHQQQQQQLQQQQQQQWRISECQSSDCDGPLIGFCLRLCLLAIAHWAIFFRKQTVTLPRLDFQRCLLISLAFLITIAYWLFFVFRVFDKRYNDFELHYMTIVQFAISMLETLILLHYVGLVLVELSQRKRVYCLKVVRSPDGSSKYYSCGTLSIQRCAQFVLEKYHRDFQQFSSYREQLLAQEDELAHHLKRQRQAQNQEMEAARRARRHASPSRRGQTSDDEDDHNDDVDDDDDQQEHDQQVGASSSRKSRRSHRHHRHHRHNSHRRHSRRGQPDSEQDEDDDHDDDEHSRSPTRRNTAAKQVVDSDLESSGDERQDKSRRTGKQARGDEEQDEADGERDSSRKRRATATKRADESAKTQAESGEFSSDTTSKLKESSLETIRAVNVNSGDAQLQQQQQSQPTAKPSEKADLEISDKPRHLQSTRATRHETESVRSGRSRRSTGSRLHRSHHNESKSTSGRTGRSSSQRRDRSTSRAATRPHTTIEVEPDDELELGAARPAEVVEEHERKVRRRKLRLLAVVEDSFEQVRLLDGNEGLKQNAEPNQPNGLDASQLARSLYPNIARPLQKYLRLTKQTGRHNLQSIYEHLSKCLLYRLSARTFLEKFVQFDPVWQQNETNLFANCKLFKQVGHNKQFDRELRLNSWSLICDTLLSRQIDSGTFFVLKQGQVSLLVSVAELPHLNLTEQVVDQNSCKFAFGSNPETSSV